MKQKAIRRTSWDRRIAPMIFLNSSNRSHQKRPEYARIQATEETSATGIFNTNIAERRLTAMPQTPARNMPTSAINSNVVNIKSKAKKHIRETREIRIGDDVIIATRVPKLQLEIVPPIGGELPEIKVSRWDSTIFLDYRDINDLEDFFKIFDEYDEKFLRNLGRG
jgi:hypothetical protein